MTAHTPAALADVAIVDFSRVLAGPFATMMLADLGATVTKVERPGVGDETRAWGPPFDDRGEATYFQAVNRNKRSLVLDLATEEGRQRARELAAAADVVVENFRPGVMERFGLHYERLRSDNPRLVYCSVTAFGTGAGAPLPGYDLLVQALGGLMSITGAPGQEPQKVGVALVDVLAGSFAAIGILAALRHRDATGEGQLVAVDLLSSLLASLVNQGSAYTIAGVVPQRLGTAHPSIAPYELLGTADGDLVLAVGNERQFRALCEVLGRADLADDSRFAGNSERVANREALREILAECFAQRSAADWSQAMTEAGVPAGIVNDVAAAFSFAASLGLAPVVSVPREDGGAVRLTRNPVALSRTPARYRSAPPSLPGA